MLSYWAPWCVKWSHSIVPYTTSWLTVFFLNLNLVFPVNNSSRQPASFHLILYILQRILQPDCCLSSIVYRLGVLIILLYLARVSLAIANALPNLLTRFLVNSDGECGWSIRIDLLPKIICRFCSFRSPHFLMSIQTNYLCAGSYDNM